MLFRDSSAFKNLRELLREQTIALNAGRSLALQVITALCAVTLAAASAAQCPFNPSGATPNSSISEGVLFARSASTALESLSTTHSGSARTSDAVRNEIAANESRLDINANGVFDEVDAAIISRYLLGFREDKLIAGGAGFGALRKTWQDVQAYIEGGCVAPAPLRKKLSVMKAEQMPQNNGGVVIFYDDNVEIDQDIDLAWLEIQGTLTCSDNHLNLSSRWIIVHGGKFRCGTPLNPFKKNLTITLTGPVSNDVALGAGMGTKVLGVMHAGGLLSLHGENRPGWTQLSQTANVGATSITLKDAMPTWRAGDKLVIAPSTFDAEDFDVVTVTSIAGNTVNFSPALSKSHWGTLQTYDGKTLDQRAAVGLLSRNIVVQGDAQSETAKFGGHIMSMANASVQMSGVELRKMGQRGRFGRYPLHWHLASDRPSDFIRNSSIHSSFQRAVVVHGTNKVTVEGNVAFDITNHAFVWAEDGNEVGNKFLRNLAVFNKNPTEAEFAFPSPNNVVHGNSTQSEFRSASFWGRNFSNTIVGNIAGGSVDGFGFFFDRFSPSTVGEREGTGLIFEDNIAHSNYRPGASGVAGEIYPEATLGHGLMVTTGLQESADHVFRRFTSYKNYGGAWLEDRVTRMQDSLLADNGVGTYVLRGVIDNVTFVNKSANTLGNAELPPKGGFAPARRAAMVVPSSHGGARAPIIWNVRVVGYTAADEYGYVVDQNDLAYSNRVDSLQMIPSGKPFAMNEGITLEYDFTDAGINDPNGQLSRDGVPTTWSSRRSAAVSANCRSDYDVYFYACPQSSLVLFRHLNAPRKFWLVEETGAMHGIGQAWTFDAAVPHENAAWNKANTVYELMREEAPGASDVEFKIEPNAGRWIELVMRAASGPSKFVLNGANVSSAGSLASLRASTASSFFYDTTTRKLHAKLVATNTTQAITINAPWELTSATDTGRAADAISGQTSGFQVETHLIAPPKMLRHRIPATQPASTTSSSSSHFSYATTLAQLPSGGDYTKVFKGWFFAPNAGPYKLSSYPISGHIDVYVGDVWVTGVRDGCAFVFPQPGLSDNDYPETGKVWLKAGWHPVTTVFTRIASNCAEGGSFDPQFAIAWAPWTATTRTLMNVFRTP